MDSCQQMKVTSLQVIICKMMIGAVILCVLRPAAAGVAKLAARDSQLRVQMLLF